MGRGSGVWAADGYEGKEIERVQARAVMMAWRSVMTVYMVLARNENRGHMSRK